jgi:hypothetical protein
MIEPSCRKQQSVKKAAEAMDDFNLTRFDRPDWKTRLCGDQIQFAWVGMILCLTPNIQELNLLVWPSVAHGEIVTHEKRVGLLGMLFGTYNVGEEDQPHTHLLPSLDRLKSLDVRGFMPEWPWLRLPALRRVVLENHHTLPPTQDDMPPATI